MQLTKNFTLDHLTYSDTALRKGIENVPNEQQIANLKRLAQVVLEPMLAQFPHMVVTNAFRTEELNEAIGGSKTSEHMNGNAADVVVPGVSFHDVAEWAADNIKVFDQVIKEWKWTHVGLRDVPRHQRMTAEKGPDGKAVYRPGF